MFVARPDFPAFESSPSLDQNAVAVLQKINDPVKFTGSQFVHDDFSELIKSSKYACARVNTVVDASFQVANMFPVDGHGNYAGAKFVCRTKRGARAATNCPRSSRSSPQLRQVLGL